MMNFLDRVEFLSLHGSHVLDVTTLILAAQSRVLVVTTLVCRLQLLVVRVRAAVIVDLQVNHVDLVLLLLLFLE